MPLDSRTPIGLPEQRPTGPVPAHHLLKALGLEDPGRIPGASLLEERQTGGLTIRRIRLPPRQDKTAAPRGIEVLQNELADPAADFDLTTFDLLYNARGQLIRVVPVPPEDIEAAYQRGDAAEVKKIELAYFDFSPFYLSMPRFGDKNMYAGLQDYRREQDANDLAAKKYMDSRFGAYSHLVSAVSADQSPFIYAEVDPLTGKSSAAKINFRYKNLVIPEADDQKYQIILPNFPSVFPPVFKRVNSDQDYMEHLYKNVDPKKNPKVLVAGPGTGVDTWIVSLRTTQTIFAVGLNPLEIANLEATAEIAGFNVVTRVGDNIIAEDGTPVFPGETFDWVVWNMPSYMTLKAGEIIQKIARRLSRYWDGDVGGRVLERFARGLAIVLKPGGRVLAWNSPPNELVDPVADAFRLTGLTPIFIDGVFDKTSDGNCYGAYLFEKQAVARRLARQILSQEIRRLQRAV